MSIKDFQDYYHDWETDNAENAIREYKQSKRFGVDNVVVFLPPSSYCMMIRTAADLVCGFGMGHIMEIDRLARALNDTENTRPTP